MSRVSVAPLFRALAGLLWMGSAIVLSACEPSSEPTGAPETVENAPGPQTEQIEVLQIGEPTGRNLETTSPDRGLEGTWTGQFRCGQAP